MCMIDDGDTPRVHSSRMVKARKEHKCDECGRTICKGEPYEYTFIVMDSASEYHTCQHCLVGCKWLSDTCDGYILGGVKGDLYEHAVDYDLLPLAIFYDCMRKKWHDEDGSMMPIPTALPMMELH